MNSKIEKSIELLKQGAIIAVPTETVYGLAVDATNLTAVNQLFALKGRSFNKPLAIAIADVSDLTTWVETISDETKKIIKAFWPGPLTLVLPAKKNVSSILKKENKIGIRCSSLATLNTIINKLGNAICLTSANISGHAEAITANDIYKIFDNKIFVCEEDEAISGIPSSVIDLTQKPFALLRETNISMTEINNCLSKV